MRAGEERAGGKEPGLLTCSRSASTSRPCEDGSRQEQWLGAELGSAGKGQCAQPRKGESWQAAASRAAPTSASSSGDAGKGLSITFLQERDPSTKHGVSAVERVQGQHPLVESWALHMECAAASHDS